MIGEDNLQIVRHPEPRADSHVTDGRRMNAGSRDHGRRSVRRAENVPNCRLEGFAVRAYKSLNEAVVTDRPC